MAKKRRHPVIVGPFGNGAKGIGTGIGTEFRMRSVSGWGYGRHHRRKAPKRLRA